jgi:hypothetical protein
MGLLAHHFWAPKPIKTGNLLEVAPIAALYVGVKDIFLCFVNILFEIKFYFFKIKQNFKNVFCLNIL